MPFAAALDIPPGINGDGEIVRGAEFARQVAVVEREEVGIDADTARGLGTGHAGARREHRGDGKLAPDRNRGRLPERDGKG